MVIFIKVTYLKHIELKNSNNTVIVNVSKEKKNSNIC